MLRFFLNSIFVSPIFSHKHNIFTVRYSTRQLADLKELMTVFIPTRWHKFTPVDIAVQQGHCSGLYDPSMEAIFKVRLNKKLLIHKYRKPWQCLLAQHTLYKKDS